MIEEQHESQAADCALHQNLRLSWRLYLTTGFDIGSYLHGLSPFARGVLMS
jgi:hypothetical protein